MRILSVRTLACFVIVSSLFVSGTPGYPGPLALYDDFNAGYIDPDKWFGVEIEQEPGGVGREAGTEAIRLVEDGRLRLFYVGYGRTDSNTGRLKRRLNLIMQDSPVVTAIQATVEVTAVTTNGCPTATAPNSDYTAAFAWLGGRFFTATDTTGTAGDVVAFIHLGRRSISPEPPYVLHAVARVWHCFDASCTKFAESLGTPTQLGTVLLGQKVNLGVQWDQGNQQFIFQRGSTTEVVSYDPTLTFIKVSDRPNKVLSAELFVSNCKDPSRPVAFIDARFDDVMVMK